MQRWVIFRRIPYKKEYILLVDRYSAVPVVPHFKRKKEAKEYLRRYLRQRHGCEWGHHYDLSYKIEAIKWPAYLKDSNES